jgi:Mn2+/Fe2+ NRAMP family transporter
MDVPEIQGIAKAIQILRLPSIAVGLISLASMVAIIFISKSHESDRFLIPSIVVLLWAISTYTFIVTFRSVPKKANKSMKFFSKLKRNINRSWHWFIGVVFVGTTVAVMVLTFRMVSIWLGSYGG